MKKQKKERPILLGATLCKDSADYLGRLRDETGIPVTHIFLMGLAKALPEIDPNFNTDTIPEIKKSLNEAHAWKKITTNSEVKT